MLRRSCACAGGRETDCEDCRKPGAVRRQTSGGSTSRGVPSLVHAVLHTSGQPLDPAMQDLMESRFGHDFSRVRVHADSSGAASARAIGAHAYTVGDHVVFAEGRYSPATTAGRTLLAHELTHVIQHATQPAGRSGSLELGAADAREEVEADAVAEGRRAPGSIRSSNAPLAVRRQAKEAQCTEEFLKKIGLVADRAGTFLRNAVVALKNVRLGGSDEASSLLDEHFHVTGDTPGSFLPDIVARMETIADTAKDWRSLMTTRCLGPESGCEGVYPARYLRDTDGERLVFCTDFPTYLDAFQIETFIHEMGHAAFKEVLDDAYARQRSYSSLTPAQAYRNADSYARFAIDVSRNLFKKGEGEDELKDAPVDDVTGCRSKGGVSEGELRAALSRAQRMNSIAGQTFESPVLLQERAARLEPFGVFRREKRTEQGKGKARKQSAERKGHLVLNEPLRRQYRQTYVDAERILARKFRVVCRTRDADDHKHYPVELSGNTLTIRESWKRSVQWFGWEKEILAMVYAQVSKRDPYLGDPKDLFRPGTAATMAHWIETDVTAERQRDIDRLEFEREFERDQEPPLRHPGKTRKRKTVSIHSKGCPVPELQEKLKATSSPLLGVTGDFKSDTEEAVAEFQAANSLLKGGGERKGVAGPGTWDALFAADPEERGLPTGEKFEVEGWNEGDSAPMVRWKQILQPTEIDFSGCHVMERTVKAREVRNCRIPLGALSGGVWPVELGNEYGPDNFGQIAGVVQRIRTPEFQDNPRSQCGYAIPQAMVLLREDAEVRKQKPEAIEKRVELGMQAEHAEYVRNWMSWFVTPKEIRVLKWNKESPVTAIRKYP